MRCSRLVFAVLVLVALNGRAAAKIEALAPIAGEAVQLVPDAQKRVMLLPTPAERAELLAKDKSLRADALWRKAKPLTLKWRADGTVFGPWKVEIGKSPDLAGARVWYFPVRKIDETTGLEAGGSEPACEAAAEIPMANLEIARDYYWRVTARAPCGPKCGPRHDCRKRRRTVSSGIAAFRTEDFAPRWIAVEGRVGNIRDFGGRRTADGRRVKQGMAYRGQGLNDNSPSGEAPGPNRMTVEDVKYLTGVLGVCTDLDLRGERETAGMKESPLGPGVAFVQRSSPSYGGIFQEDGMKAMAENFRVFCDGKNYPVYFHCIGGVDRTGSLAYVMNAVLGVARHEIETDWEASFYPDIPDAKPGKKSWRRRSDFDEGFAKYGKEGDSLATRVERYLLDCGVVKEEIEAFRSLMLE